MIRHRVPELDLALAPRRRETDESTGGAVLLCSHDGDGSGTSL